MTQVELVFSLSSVSLLLFVKEMYLMGKEIGLIYIVGNDVISIKISFLCVNIEK